MIQIGVKWVYKIKMKPNGSGKIAQYKVRLAAKGFQQRRNIERRPIDEVFASVARTETVKPVVVMASRKGCSMYQLHVKFAFLNWSLHDEMYVKQPPRGQSRYLQLI